MQMGIVGAGHLGGGLALRLLERGHEVMVYDPSAAAVAPLVAAGAVAADSPAAVAARCPVVSFVVFDDIQLHDAINGEDGAAGAAGHDHLFLVHSTVSANVIIALSERVRDRGVELLDVGTIAANFQVTGQGPLFLVGGSPAVVERARPALDAMGGRIVHVGPLGMGIKAKIARNAATYWMFLGLHQGFAIAEAGGITEAAFQEVLDASHDLTPGGFIRNPRDYPNRGPILRKDLLTALDQAAEGGVDLPETRWLVDRADDI